MRGRKKQQQQQQQIGQEKTRQQKQKKMDNMIASHKLMAWHHPGFKRIIAAVETKKRSTAQLAVPWQKMCVRWGGKAEAQGALADGDIVAHAPAQISVCEQPIRLCVPMSRR